MPKTKLKLSLRNNNITTLIDIASKAMKKDGREYEANEMSEKILACDRYNDALLIVMNYCDVVELI